MFNLKQRTTEYAILSVMHITHVDKSICVAPCHGDKQ